MKSWFQASRNLIAKIYSFKRQTWTVCICVYTLSYSWRSCLCSGICSRLCGNSKVFANCKQQARRRDVWEVGNDNRNFFISCSAQMLCWNWAHPSHLTGGQLTFFFFAPSVNNAVTCARSLLLLPVPSDPRGWCCWVGAITSRWNARVAVDPASFFSPGQESVIFLIDLLPGYGVFRWSKLNLYGGSKFPGLHSAWISLSHFMCKICDYKFPTVVLLSTRMDCLSCTAFWLLWFS